MKSGKSSKSLWLALGKTMQETSDRFAYSKNNGTTMNKLPNIQNKNIWWQKKIPKCLLPSSSPWFLQQVVSSKKYAMGHMASNVS